MLRHSNATLAEADCPSLVSDMLALVPFGPWVQEAQAGNVTFDPAESVACLSTLQTAICGADVLSALLDGTCFGFAAPLGGTEQRSMFGRFQGAGKRHWCAGSPRR